MKKIILLFLISIFLFTGCGEKELKYKVENKENYEFRIKVNGTIRKKSFNKNLVISKYNDKQLKVLEDGEILYYVFDNKIYKDEYGKNELKEKHPKDYSYLYEILDTKKKIIDKGDDLIGKKTYQFYSYLESKKNMNKLFKTLGIDVKVSNKAKAVLYLDDGYINNIFYKVNEKNEEYRIDIEYFDFNNVKKIKQKITDDIIELDDSNHKHDDDLSSKYNIIDEDVKKEDNKRRKPNGNR